ncbi:MAG: hypothetical protein R6W96_00145 [Clostridia bacterium]
MKQYNLEAYCRDENVEYLIIKADIERIAPRWNVLQGVKALTGRFFDMALSRKTLNHKPARG